MLRANRILLSKCFGAYRQNSVAAAQEKGRRIEKLLIANRGEIACRVQKTAQQLGIQTVAVYSEADANSLHVQMADRAVCIGPPPSTESYLRIDKILSAARETGADAIHPGYGFLSESVEFAQQCAENDVIFVGPPASAIRDMGIKSTSKRIMSEAGVPIIEGYHGEDQSDEKLLEEARKIGFPVMLKAVRGGGGKGMRISHSEQDFSEQLESARLEAQKAFADDIMLVEKFVENPRHVEVQVFGDSHGNYVYLWERDCSIQRRHQKVLEEAPAPGIGDEVRRAIGEAAVRAARAVGYVGAGTVEFIMDRQHKFYFMEMNTRLQVEHPVTELITGQDLVDWQLSVAAGAELPLKQEELPLRGHALEARLYAEDPNNNFLPGAGHLLHLHFPTTEGVRVDTGVRQGDDVTVHYDPMIAKLIVWAPDRDSALQRMHRALTETRIVGPSTNLSFLTRLVSHPNVHDDQLHTGFIEENQATLLTDPKIPAQAQAVAAIVAAFKLSSDSGSQSSWDKCGSLRINHPLEKHVVLNHQSDKLNATVKRTAHNMFEVQLGDETVELQLDQSAAQRLSADAVHADVTCIHDDFRYKYHVIQNGKDIHVTHPPSGHSFCLSEEEPLFREQELSTSGAGRGAVAPMPGVIDRILVSPGDSVKAGDSLLVMIAMKMEYVIKSSTDGVIESVPYQAGDTVQKGTLLVKIDAQDDQ